MSPNVFHVVYMSPKMPANVFLRLVMVSSWSPSRSLAIASTVLGEAGPWFRGGGRGARLLQQKHVKCMWCISCTTTFSILGSPTQKGPGGGDRGGSDGRGVLQGKCDLLAWKEMPGMNPWGLGGVWDESMWEGWVCERRCQVAGGARGRLWLIGWECNGMGHCCHGRDVMVEPWWLLYNFKESVGL